MTTSMKERFKILMIEDDVDLCAGWMDVFELIGHDLKCYHHALDALNDVEAITTADLLISDFYLPDLNGVELIKKVRELNPAIKAILLTGSRDNGVLAAARALPHCSILHKPTNIDDVDEKIKQLLVA